MKFTQAQLIEAVRAAGVPVVEVVEDGSDYTTDTFLTTIDTAREPIIKQKVLPDLEAEATRKISGLVGDKLMVSLAKATGIARSKFPDTTDEEKIKFALDSFKETMGQNEEGLRTELTTALAKHTEAMDGLKAEHATALNAANQKYIDRDIQAYIANTVLKDAPLPDGADRNIQAADFKRHLQDKYSLTYDEATKIMALASKDNPALPALNAAKTAAINPTDEAKDFFTQRGMWSTDMRRAVPKLPNGQPYIPGSGTPPPSDENGATDPLKSMNEGLNKFLADKAIPA